MSNVHRLRRPSISLFFTVSLSTRGSDLLVRHVEVLRDAVRRTKAERPFHIRAMVILPDHLHAIWTLPKVDDDYSARWEMIKARFAKAISEKTSGASPARFGNRDLWQRRFREHSICSEAEKHRLTRACWADPVNHGLVTDPFDWPHSSIHRDAIRNGQDAMFGCGLSHAFDGQRPVIEAPEGASCRPI